MDEYSIVSVIAIRECSIDCSFALCTNPIPSENMNALLMWMHDGVGTAMAQKTHTVRIAASTFGKSKSQCQRLTMT